MNVQALLDMLSLMALAGAIYTGAIFLLSLYYVFVSTALHVPPSLRGTAGYSLWFTILTIAYIYLPTLSQ